MENIEYIYTYGNKFIVYIFLYCIYLLSLCVHGRIVSVFSNVSLIGRLVSLD